MNPLRISSNIFIPGDCTLHTPGQADVIGNDAFRDTLSFVPQVL